jgi:Amt family ammonium transporter
VVRQFVVFCFYELMFCACATMIVVGGSFERGRGLVGITPAAGYVSLWLAAVIGFLTAIVICCFENVNEWLGIDDGLEVFKLHGIGGMCGAFLTGIFATSKVSSLDGVTLAPGAIDGNGIQVAKQLAEIAAIASYSFVCSLLMLLIMKYIPGLHLRVNDEVEMIGYDVDQFHDELIGEWSTFDSTPPPHVTHGVPMQHGTSSSSVENVANNAPEAKA